MHGVPFEVPPGHIVLRFEVPPELAGMRLDRFLQLRIRRLSRARARRIVERCARRADGGARKPGERVREGEVVFVVRPRPPEPHAPRTFRELYRDEEVLAVDKPPGLPMHPTATWFRNTLTAVLRERYGEPPPRIAHRLDRETSGVVICGRTGAAERSLKIAFERRRTRKRYLAIVRGDLDGEEGVVRLPLARRETSDRVLHVLMEVAPRGGLEAETRWRVLARRAGRTLLQVEIGTGRQHQIRVHLAAIGHPVLGDKLYGPNGPEVFLRYVQEGSSEAVRRLAGHWRHALHAHWLEVPHPRDGSPLRLRSPLPRDMAELWKGRSSPCPLD